MEITIEDAIKCLGGPCKGCEYKSCIMPESTDIAIETMRKYQKIEQIVKVWNDMNSFDSMIQISEVIEDGRT